MIEPQHVYTSELGTEFLSFAAWVSEKGTLEEKALYDSQVQSEELHFLFQRWKEDQKIIKHEAFENGVKVMEADQTGRIL